MRETNFIKQNKEKWKAFERLLEHDEKDPDKLNDLFVQITDDLSYSRTYYPNRSVRVYLNNLAQQVFYSIYKSKRLRGGRLWFFWTDELPQLVYEARQAFRLSLVIFILSMLIGMLSSHMNPEFPRVILGDNYVDMTIENINSGDPMAVYKEKGEFGMSLGITANNLFVAFLTFGLGIFFGIGSAGVLISNGVMVGAFQYFFIEKGLFQESFLTIWTHGTLEISAIIIAGAAGITMGRGLSFPGTLTRLQAFQISARRGMKIMFGIAPIIILAGIIEGYLTRYTETPDIIRLLFILLCLAFILGYFVYYPVRKARIGFKAPIKDTELPPDNLQEIRFDRIKTSGEVFSDIFRFYKKILNQILLLAIAAGLLFCVCAVLINTDGINGLFIHPNQLFGAITVIDQYFVNESLPYLYVSNIIIYSLVAFVPLMYLIQYIDPDRTKDKPRFHLLIQYGKMILPIGLILLIIATGNWYTLFLFAFVAPILFLWTFINYYEEINVFQGLGRTFSLLSGNVVHLFGLFTLLILVGLLFYGIMDTFLLWFFIDMIGWNLSMDQNTMDAVFVLLLAFTSVFFLSLIFTIMSLGAGLLYFSLIEIEDAPSLKARIKQIGQRRRIQGIEAEER
jgi:uncharacterized membrane protein SpoIIM required for sporulation